MFNTSTIFPEAKGGYLQFVDWKQHAEWLDHGFVLRETNDWPDIRRVAILRQMHSDIVVRVDDQKGFSGEGDAMITDKRGVYLTVRTADCVPILIADPVRRAVAAVHAGWRGAAAEIAVKTVRRMQQEYGCNIADLEVLIGPGIGKCCYEVGPEVAARFARWFPLYDGITEKVRMDVAEASRRQLADIGVHKLHGGVFCAACDRYRFHSVRRDGSRAGRNLSCIALKSEPVSEDELHRAWAAALEYGR
ncbi:MAG: peptidoglycan editing factor PgeF [Candidatus Solibacter usitatus]|nr:peptidoglycan editing factor PgeF [Candidatus Solibacter usitatus]